MTENNNPVAEDQMIPEESADDAQAAETISAEELAAQLLSGANVGKTAEHAGDGDQPGASDDEVQDRQRQSDKRDNQIRAALKQQRKTIFEDELGESEETVRELIRAHRAEKITKEDPDISPKAAMRIVKAQEAAKRQQTEPDMESMKAAVLTLMEDGWTEDELRAFAADEQAQEEMAQGKSIRAAARAYEKRQMQAAPARKTGVPTIRRPAASGAPARNLIDEMSDAEFAKFSDRAYRALMDGKRVTFDD